MTRITTALVSLFVLSGCAHEAGFPDFYADETEAKFGAAVRQNVAAQTVNPNAPEGDSVTASGARTAIAQERYEKDEVEKPKDASTLRATQPGQGSEN